MSRRAADKNTLKFSHIADLLQCLDLPYPTQPLITLIDYNKVKLNLADAGKGFLLDFYKVSFRDTFNGSLKYGPGTYDFRNGGLAFVAPHQLVEMSANAEEYQGYALYFHPDLLHNYPLAGTIRRYGFFSYSVSESLFLSGEEKSVVSSIFKAIEQELGNNIDSFSQDVLVSQLELLLNHCNRFYNRQFLSRKNLHHDLIDRLNSYLTEYFQMGSGITLGLPSPPQIALQLKVSQRYLSDLLRALTGNTTQQYIHLWLIDKAKEMLSSDSLMISEIAYQLGFEHPQSFHKLFRQKTRLSPQEFRQLTAPGP